MTWTINDAPIETGIPPEIHLSNDHNEPFLSLLCTERHLNSGILRILGDSIQVVPTGMYTAIIQVMDGPIPRICERLEIHADEAIRYLGTVVLDLQVDGAHVLIQADRGGCGLYLSWRAPYRATYRLVAAEVLDVHLTRLGSDI